MLAEFTSVLETNPGAFLAEGPHGPPPPTASKGPGYRQNAEAFLLGRHCRDMTGKKEGCVCRGAGVRGEETGTTFHFV